MCALLNERGVWGCKEQRPGDQYNKSGYWEPWEIKNIINSHRDPVYRTLEVSKQIPNFKAQVEQIIRKNGYKGGPWLQKVDVFAYKLYEDFDPFYVKVMRDKEGIMKSIKRTPFMYKQGYSDKEWERIIDAHHELMGEVQGYVLETEDIAAGDETGLDICLERYSSH